MACILSLAFGAQLVDLAGDGLEDDDGVAVGQGWHDVHVPDLPGPGGIGCPERDPEQAAAEGFGNPHVGVVGRSPEDQPRVLWFFHLRHILRAFVFSEKP